MAYLSVEIKDLILKELDFTSQSIIIVFFFTDAKHHLAPVS